MPRKRVLATVGCTLLALLAPQAQACTRVVYETSNNTYLVGRTMDWYDNTGTDLWAFPRGMARDGGVGPGSITWTSKYGSLVADIYDIASADGMNEAGLVGNILYLAEADYGDAKTTGKPLLSGGAWLQYVLDNYATVKEAVEALRAEPFAILAPPLPGGKPAGGHLSIADQSGDSAILEYIGGKLTIHHDRKHTVMTNSPPFGDQLAINTYWKDVGGLKMLPGTHRASDRFARVSWNLNAAAKVADPKAAVATVFSITRNISVPLGISDPEKPNIAATLWRTTADIAARRYFFESTMSPAIFWVDLAKLNLAPGAKPTKLDLSSNPVLSGEVSDKFSQAEPFKFLSH
jgi:choloylglycine hydrolase